ncbi:MAG: SoxR reducing system RseC family protein [Candidatus Cryptobacteroides sp.]|nr:SoxR reducing system RseC family protein [Bacteroidales bacterium]
MASGKSISHKGKVLKVEDGVVSVEIISQSACSACHAAGLCSMSEAVSKVVEVPLLPGTDYAPGENVEVLLSPSMGMKAVTAAYVVPLAVLVLICVSLSYAGVNEIITGTAGLCGVAVWYLCLYFARGHFSKEYVFNIRKENNYNL